MSEGDLASSKLSGLMRTHTCGELRESDIGKEVTLCGWNNKYRDLGGLHFIDVRDKYGMTQLAFDEFEEDITKLKSLSLETVVKISGVVRQRPDSAINKDMDTGGVEVSVRKLEELSHAAELPFLPQSKVATSENLKLKYRYLDLRNKHLQDILSTRSNVMRKVRCALYEEEFTEVETPILYKTTPEGARDYVVPSRIHKGQFYALPQSPQTLKQLLMIANTDKYFQICKCFRDEDLRADRQPEFSQIDIEVSFATQEYIKNLTTKVVRSVFDLKSDFEIPVMSYDQALEDYGTDKPDLRFGLKHFVVNDLMNGLGFKVFQDAIDGNGLVKTFFVPKDMKEFSRKELDGLGDIVKPYGGKGVAWFKVSSEGIVGGISKFINDETLKKLQERISASEGTFLFFADVKESVAHASGDAARRHLGKELGLIDPNEYKFLWVNDWPLLDYDEEEKRFYAVHHPFTMFKSEDEEKYRSGDVEQLKTVRADAYDIVCNGYEMGGGSLRIYKEDIQQKMFEYLGMEESEIKAKFGFFIEALKYGTPPHGGFAFGLDRTVMLVTHTDNIRDVISFPKTNQASDLMSASPSAVTQEQMDELSLTIRE